MSKITVGVPPIFSPLLCPQKSWEKVDCQIEQHKKHTYNIKTIGPFFFLNPTNKKNYPFLLFLPNYTPEPLPKKCNSCTLTIKFPKFIPSITFLSNREDQIREIYEYITRSKAEINVFLDNVKISENITSMDFDQYSENLNKPISVIPNIQFMNGKWQLQTLYKEQAKELKTILIECQKVIALPCYEIPHKFGSNDIAIYSFFVMSKTDPLPVYFKTPEIDEMIKWILFIYAYLHNSPNAVGAPFPRMQTMPIIKSMVQSSTSTTENNNDSSNIPRSSTITNQPPKPKPGVNQKPNVAQKPNPSQQQKPNSSQQQKPNSSQHQKPNSSQQQRPNSSQQQKPISNQPQKPNSVQLQKPQRQTQISASQSTDAKRRAPLERKTSNQSNSSNRPVAASQMNIKKPTQPSQPVSKSPSKPQNNLSQSQNPNSPKPGNRTARTSSNTASMSSIPEIKINNTNDNKINISNTNSSTTNNNNNENDNKNTNQSQNSSKTNDEPEKEEFQAFSFTFESVDIDKASNKVDIDFPTVQFADPDANNTDENNTKNNQNSQENPTSESTQKQPVATTSVSTMQSRARSFSEKRRNSSISSEALDCIRSDKSHDLNDNDDYKIPQDIESRIEKSITELDKKYSNIKPEGDKKIEVFHPPDYKDIISSTIVSMSTLASSNSRSMQIKTLLNTIDNDTQNDIVDFPFVDQVDEKTVEETLSTMSSEDNIDLSSYFKFNEYPEYNISQLTNSARPRDNFIDEFTLIDQGLRQSGSMNLDLNNYYVVRLCFLVACTIVNGLKDFNDQYSTVSIVEPFRQLSLLLNDLNPIISEISDVQTTCEQASIAATMLIKKNLLGTFLREVKRTDNWAPKYYLQSAMLSNYEFIDTFVLMLEPMLNTMTFNVEISPTIFKSVSLDDANRYAFTPLFAYLEIDDLFKVGADPVKIISKQFEVGLKKSKKFLNSSAWDVLEKLSQDQRYSAAYYAKFMNSINASKAFFGSSKSKLESWVSEAISSKTIHSYFMLVHINLTLLNTPEYYEESSIIDPFRANYIMKKLCKFVSRP